MAVTAGPEAAAAQPISNGERLARWESATRPAIIAAALIPLIGVAAGTEHFGPVGNTIEVACWAVFVVDLVVHMRLRPGYLQTGMGRFDLAVVVLTSPWYLLLGVDGGEFITILRLARIARVAMVGLQTPVLRRTAERLGKPFIYVGIMLVVCSGIVMRAEDHRNGFDTYGDALWWGLVTMTTVGYGDIVPETRVGRITASVLMLTGVALLGTVAASLASLFRLEDKEAEEAEEAAGDMQSTGRPSPNAAPNAAPSAAEVVDELRALRAEVAALREDLGRRPS